MAVRAVLGPATAGILHAYGAGTWTRLAGTLAGEDRAYAQAADRAMGVYNAQVIRAVIGRAIGRYFPAAVREAIAILGTPGSRIVGNVTAKLPAVVLARMTWWLCPCTVRMVATATVA